METGEIVPGEPDPEEIYGPTTPWQRKIEEKRLYLEGRLAESIETGAPPATVSRFRNQLAKLPPVYQEMRDSLLLLRSDRPPTAAKRQRRKRKPPTG